VKWVAIKQILTARKIAIVTKFVKINDVESAVPGSCLAIRSDALCDFKKGSSWNRVGEFRGLKAQESCAFLAILDFGRGFDLASEMDDKSGEATSATVGCV
jgi:hypothetical protein